MEQQRISPSLGYILKGYPRISETFISNEILLLEQLGLTMRLFPMRKPRETITHQSVKKIKAKVDYLPSELIPEFYRLLLPNIFLAVKKPELYRKALAVAREGLSSKPGKRLATLKHLFQAGYLTRHHLKKDSGVVHLHGHFAHSPTSVTMFAAILANIGFSFTAHAKDIYTSRPEKLKRKIDLADFVVTCTKHNKKYLQKIGERTTTPIHCIYHGIDLSLFNNTSPRKNGAPPYKILTVARMTEKKGLPTIYKALALLRDKGFQFHHTLIGDGDDRQEILELISSLGLEQQCIWLGTRTHEEVLLHFKKSDLFVLGCEIAKNGDRDGIPNVLVESLAMGVPSISTKVSAIPEILIDANTGITVEPSHPEILAEKIQQTLENKQLREKLTSAGQEYVQQNFNNRQWIKDLYSIFTNHQTTLIKDHFPDDTNR